MNRFRKHTDSIDKLIQFIAQYKLKCKLIFKEGQTDWLDWITIPVDGYLDYGATPVRFSCVLGIRLSPFVVISKGRLLPHLIENYTQEIYKYLDETGYFYSVEHNEFIILL